MNAKTVIDYILRRINTEDTDVVNFMIQQNKQLEDLRIKSEQQANQIKAMRNCHNCHYKEYTKLEMPYNNCIRCFKVNEEDCWELRAKLQMKETNNNE